EYSQRLASRARNVVAGPNGSTGRTLFDGALSGGGRALGCRPGLQEGHPADFVSLDCSAAPYLKEDQILDGWIFAGSVRPDCVWVNGFKQVEGGRHRRREKIAAGFHAAMKGLMES